MAAVLDEALGAAAWADGYPILVARLAVDFRQLLPLGTDATFETWVAGVDGRKVTTRGRLLLPDGSVVAEGEALCVMLAQEHIDRLQAVRVT
jgi:acyl-CoA thioesterase FadM